MKEYKVVCVDAGCCSHQVDPKDVEKQANSMAQQGYSLNKYTVDSRALCGPFCAKKSGIMIFERDGDL